MDSNEPREGTTDYYARIGFREDIRRRARASLDSAIDTLTHEELIDMAEKHGVQGVAHMALGAAHIASEPVRDAGSIWAAHREKGHPSGYVS